VARRAEKQRPSAAPQQAELVVEAVAAQGDGVAAGPVYVPLTLPGERVTASVAGDRGELMDILSPSPERVAPPCPHFGQCGGCALQHWDHGAYLAWKVDQIARTLARERIETEFAPAFAALVSIMRNGASVQEVAAFVRANEYHVALSHEIESQAEEGTFAEGVFNVLCGD
jgi:tRNA/tmRNA/rRNA uracil-C5-methylase (TrmA/RlmC/RlmD family)